MQKVWYSIWALALARHHRRHFGAENLFRELGMEFHACALCSVTKDANEASATLLVLEQAALSDVRFPKLKTLTPCASALDTCAAGSRRMSKTEQGAMPPPVLDPSTRKRHLYSNTMDITAANWDSSNFKIHPLQRVTTIFTCKTTAEREANSPINFE